MRRAARVDGNHTEILCGLNRIPGVTARSLAAVGDGMPDIIVGYLARNFLFEVKDPAQPPSKRKLTKRQEMFHHWWAGDVRVIETLDEALEAMRVR